MAQIIDPNNPPDDDFEIDERGLFCPKCGCNGVEVIRLPRPDSWMNREGKAKCNSCQIVFPIVMELEQDDDPSGIY